MARWEDEDLTGLNIPDPDDFNESLFDKTGKETKNEQIAFAKTSTVNDNKTHYLKYGRGEIVDPHQIDANSRNSHLYSFKRVNEQAFEQYMTYLKTKNRLYFTRARRILMETRL